MVSDKPLAMTAAESKTARRRSAARRRRRCRDLQLPRQSARSARAPRHRARRHRHAAVRARLLPAGLAAERYRLLLAAGSGEGRRLVGARRHRLALVRPGAARDRADDHARARRHHHGTPDSERGRAARARHSAAGGGEVDVVDIRVEDLASVLVRFENGAKGTFSVGQVCAGHKNDLVLEVCGSKASVRWRQEQQNELWFGHRERANEVLQKDPSLHRRRRASLRASARRPSGGVGGRLLQSDARHLRRHRRRAAVSALPPAVATFEDGYRANRIVEAILESAETGRRLDARCHDRRAVFPKFMKVGVLTAALQELTPREVRDADPDRAIEDWLAFAQRSGADYIQLSAALHPSEADVPPEAMLDPVANTLDLRQPFDGRAPRACRRPSPPPASASRTSPTSTTCCTTTPATRQPEARLPAARVRRRGAARRRRGLRLRRPQPAAQHGREPRRLRGAFRPAAEGGEGARAHLPRRAVPDARLDHRRQLAQQHRLHAGRVDRAAPHLRAARRRRSVPHPLRPVARHPDGTGHALDLPVSEGRRATAS